MQISILYSLIAAFLLASLICPSFSNIDTPSYFTSTDYSSQLYDIEEPYDSSFTPQDNSNAAISLYAMPTSPLLNSSYFYGFINIDAGVDSQPYLSRCALFEGFQKKAFRSPCDNTTSVCPVTDEDADLYCARGSDPYSEEVSALSPDDGIYFKIQWSDDYRATANLSLFNRCTPSLHVPPCGILADHIGYPTSVGMHDFHVSGMSNITFPNPFDPSCYYNETATDGSIVWHRDSSCDFAQYDPRLFVAAFFGWGETLPSSSFGADVSWYWRKNNQNYTIASQTVTFRFYKLPDGTNSPSIFGATIVPNLINPIYNEYNLTYPLIWNDTIFEDDIGQGWQAIPTPSVETTNFTLTSCQVPFNYDVPVTAAFQYHITSVPQAYAGVLLKHAGGTTFHVAANGTTTSVTSIPPRCSLNGITATVTPWGSSDPFYLIRIPNSAYLNGYRSYDVYSDLYLRCTGLLYLSGAVPHVIMLQLLPPSMAATLSSISPYTFINTRTTYINYIQCGQLPVSCRCNETIDTPTCVKGRVVDLDGWLCGDRFFEITAQNNYPYYYISPFGALRFTGNVRQSLVLGDKTLAHYQQTFRLQFMENNLAQNYNISGHINPAPFNIPIQFQLDNVFKSKILTAYYTFSSMNLTMSVPLADNRTDAPASLFPQSLLDDDDPLQELPFDTSAIHPPSVRIQQRLKQEQSRRMQTMAQRAAANQLSDDELFRFYQEKEFIESTNEFIPFADDTQYFNFSGIVIGYDDIVTLQNGLVGFTEVSQLQTRGDQRLDFDILTLKDVYRPPQRNYTIYNETLGFAQEVVYMLLVDIVLEVPASTPATTSARVVLNYGNPLMSDQVDSEVGMLRTGFFSQGSPYAQALATHSEFFASRVTNSSLIENIQQLIIDHYSSDDDNSTSVSQNQPLHTAQSSVEPLPLSDDNFTSPSFTVLDSDTTFSKIAPYSLYWNWNSTISNLNTTRMFWLSAVFSTGQFSFTGSFQSCRINDIPSIPYITALSPAVEGQITSSLVFDLRPILALEDCLPMDIASWNETEACSNTTSYTPSKATLNYVIVCDDVWVTNATSVIWSGLTDTAAANLYSNKISSLQSTSFDNSTTSIAAAQAFAHHSPQTTPVLFTVTCEVLTTDVASHIITSTIVQWDSRPYDPYRWIFFIAAVVIGGCCIACALIWLYAGSSLGHSRTIHRSTIHKTRQQEAKYSQQLSKEIQLSMTSSHLTPPKDNNDRESTSSQLDMNEYSTYALLKD